MKKTGFKKALLGMSGGIDSALVAAIACDALGSENVRLVMLPSKYNGDWLYGKGELKLANGFKYIGEWTDGEITGLGKATYNNGNVYSGYLKKAQPHGVGKMIYISGRVFKGIWDNGKEKTPLCNSN